MCETIYLPNKGALFTSAGLYLVLKILTQALTFRNITSVYWQFCWEHVAFINSTTIANVNNII